MTLYNLQEALKNRVEEAAKEAAFYGLQVFIHNLPPQKYEGDAEKKFPLCLIRAEDGEDGAEESSVTITLTFGTKDELPKMQGYMDVCHLIEIMRLNLAENNYLDGRYEIKGPVHFTLSDDPDNSYPFYFGAVWFDVIIPSPGGGYNDLT